MSTLQHCIKRFRENEALSSDERIPIDRQQFWWKDNSSSSVRSSSISNLSHSQDFSIDGGDNVNTIPSNGMDVTTGIDMEMEMSNHNISEAEADAEHIEEFVSLNAYTDYLIKACDDLLIRNQNVDAVSDVDPDADPDAVSSSVEHPIEDPETPIVTPASVTPPEIQLIGMLVWVLIWVWVLVRVPV